MVRCYTTLTSYMCGFVVHVCECMCICMRVSTCVDVSIRQHSSAVFVGMVVVVCML